MENLSAPEHVATPKRIILISHAATLTFPIYLEKLGFSFMLLSHINYKILEERKSDQLVISR